MTSIAFDSEQIETLRTTVEAALTTLRFEISHTDHREFRDMLRHRSTVLEGVLAKLQSDAPS